MGDQVGESVAGQVVKVVMMRITVLRVHEGHGDGSWFLARRFHYLR